MCRSGAKCITAEFCIMVDRTERVADSYSLLSTTGIGSDSYGFDARGGLGAEIDARGRTLLFLSLGG